MIGRLLGFDLVTERPPELGRSVVVCLLASFVRVVPYILLVALLPAALAGTLPVSALTVLGVLSAAFLLDWWLTAEGLARSFSATYRLVAQMRLGMADHLGRMALGRVLSRSGSTLADLLTDRFGLYQDIATHMWWQILTMVPLPAFLWLLLMIVDWRIGLIVAAGAPLAALTVPWSFRLLDRAAERVIPARDRLAERVVELVEGAQDVRVLDPAGTRCRAAEAAVRELRLASVRTELAPAPAILAFGLVWWLVLAVTIVFAALPATRETAEPAALIASLVLATRLCAEMAEFGVFLVEARIARRVLMTIREVMDDPVPPAPSVPKAPCGADVEIRDVSFSHGGDTALRGISLTIPAGTVTALVGPSGAGKSSLAALVARLWDVDRGSIRIGGVDVRDMSAETLNATVSMVLQDVALFDLTVEDNIRLGRPDATRADVVAAARAARIHERIEGLPEGYDTVLTGSGAALSGGERQRLAIARALLKDAPVLVLDEATASIDLGNEHLIHEALARLVEGRTVIVIAHRLYAVAGADQVAVLDRGRIVEIGAPSALRDRPDGVFAAMWRHQVAAEGWVVGST